MWFWWFGRGAKPLNVHYALTPQRLEAGLLGVSDDVGLVGSRVG